MRVAGRSRLQLVLQRLTTSIQCHPSTRPPKKIGTWIFWGGKYFWGKYLYRIWYQGIKIVIDMYIFIRKDYGVWSTTGTLKRGLKYSPNIKEWKCFREKIPNPKIRTSALKYFGYLFGPGHKKLTGQPKKMMEKSEPVESPLDLVTDLLLHFCCYSTFCCYVLLMLLPFVLLVVIILVYFAVQCCIFVCGSGRSPVPKQAFTFWPLEWFAFTSSSYIITAGIVHTFLANESSLIVSIAVAVQVLYFRNWQKKVSNGDLSVEKVASNRFPHKISGVPNYYDAEHVNENQTLNRVILLRCRREECCGNFAPRQANTPRDHCRSILPLSPFCLFWSRCVGDSPSVVNTLLHSWRFAPTVGTRSPDDRETNKRKERKRKQKQKQKLDTMGGTKRMSQDEKRKTILE